MTGENMNRIIITLLLLAFVIFGVFGFFKRSEACSRFGEVNIRQTCMMAEYIVRATAVEYSEPPDNPDSRTSGIPASKVIFKIEEILKGDSLKGTIDLNGYLSNKDEFNDHPVPYNFVRQSGRAGSCYTNTYKQGAQFLLFLKSSDHVKWPGITTPFTVNIDPLAPVNEELHSPDDPWVYYIKGLIEGLKENSKTEKPSK